MRQSHARRREWSFPASTDTRATALLEPEDHHEHERWHPESRVQQPRAPARAAAQRPRILHFRTRGGQAVTRANLSRLLDPSHDPRTLKFMVRP